jgi:uncharacterized membrane protein
MKPLRWMRAALSLTIAAGMPAIATAQIVDRGTLPGGTSCSAAGVNSRGTSIGLCTGSHASGGHAVGVYQLLGDSAPTPLPVLAAGKGCRPVALSDMGATDFAAGSCEDAAGDTRAVRWAANGQGRFATGPQILMPLQGLIGLGADLSASVAAINRYGVVAGDSIAVTGRHRAVVWLAGSVAAVPLPEPPVSLVSSISGCSATAINHAVLPKVVGTCQVTNGIDVADIALRWTTGAVGALSAAVLGDIGGNHCGAVDVNLGGDAVGSCADADGDATAILWAANTLDPFIIVAADQSMAAGINDNGAVAGSYITDDGYLHAYVGMPLRTPALTDVGTLPGGHHCGAVGLDAAGNAAVACDTGTLQSTAALYSPSRGLAPLGTLGGPSSGPTGIALGGTVVGNSTTAGGYGHAFILGPASAIAARGPVGARTVPVGGSAARKSRRAGPSSAASAQDNPMCAAWVANGFAASAFYTAKQKRDYCPIASGLGRAHAAPPVSAKDDSRCAAWIANGFLNNAYYSDATKRKYCPASAG